MRIVQLIDSLEAGGAERMAVNYANALAAEIEFSGLVSTRAEGSLKSELLDSVDYLFLNKRKTIDKNAILNCRRYCVENKIDIIHAHSTSYFLAVLVKLLLPKIKIIWHNHNGMSLNLPKYKIIILKLFGKCFSGTIVVNEQLKDWTTEILKIKNVVYLENFSTISNQIDNSLKLEGSAKFKIICVANLRPEKNHFLLIDVAEKILNNRTDCSFHIVGKDFQDSYSATIKKLVIERSLENTIFFYGAQNNIPSLLLQANIGLLTSNLEGLPVALLEYGMAGLGVVVTSTGAIPSIVENGKNGFLVDVGDFDGYYEALNKTLDDIELRIQMGKMIKQKVIETYSSKVVLTKYLKWIKKC